MTQEQEQQAPNTLSQLLSIAKNVDLDGKLYETVIMLVAPYEMADIQADKNILQAKLSTELDMLLEEQGVENSPVFSIISPAEFVNVEELFRRCEYAPTSDTIVAARVFGMVDDKTQPECLPYYVLCKDSKVGLIHKDKVKQEHLL